MSTIRDTATLDSVLDRVDANFDASLDRLGEILRIPSVSTDPAHDGDVRAAADWFVGVFRELGLTAESISTPGHPVVLASSPAPEVTRLSPSPARMVSRPDPVVMVSASRPVTTRLAPSPAFT